MAKTIEDTPQKRTRSRATTRSSQTEGLGSTLTRENISPTPGNITTIEPRPRVQHSVVQGSSSEEDDDNDVQLIRRRWPLANH